MPAEATVTVERRVKLFRNGRNQAVRIPRDLELPGTEAFLRKEDGVLTIRPIDPKSLIEWLKAIEPWDEEFPEIEDHPPEPVDI
jgi:antitoxin VapB